jgi:hypothetical protein
VNATDKIACDSHINRSIPFAGEDVNVEGHLSRS